LFKHFQTLLVVVREAAVVAVVVVVAAVVIVIQTMIKMIMKINYNNHKIFRDCSKRA
jgi:hypothetical protein